MLEDDKAERIDEIREEIEERTSIGNDVGNNRVGEEDDEVEEASFHGDNSNLDSSENEVVTLLPKRVRRIPPPNPPYRTRLRGRYFMLKVRTLTYFKCYDILFSSLWLVVYFLFTCIVQKH